MKVSNSQVEFAIAVEVTHRHRKRRISRTVVDGCLEAAIPFAEEHRDVG